MRRILGGLAAATLALTAVPALAADEPAVLAPCTVPAGATVLTLAKAATTSVTTPQLPGDTTSADVVLDLAGQPAGSTASVSTVLSWALPVNDYDLETSGGGSSQLFNFDQTEPSETATGTGIGHCETFTVTAVNFAAPVVVDTLAAELSATLEEPVEEE